MFTQHPELNNDIQGEVPAPSQNYYQQQYLLQAVIEGFVDGILILTEGGELFHANERARQICNHLWQNKLQSNFVAQEIWRIYQSLIENYKRYPNQKSPDQKAIVESELATDNSVTYRLRARWLNLVQNEQRLLLITLEDRQQSHQSIVIADVKKYGLTAREAEVWLLRRANHSYKQIADKLYITLNTVKKHMKNIHAKQQGLFWAEQ